MMVVSSVGTVRVGTDIADDFITDLCRFGGSGEWWDYGGSSASRPYAVGMTSKTLTAHAVSLTAVDLAAVAGALLHADAHLQPALTEYMAAR